MTITSERFVASAPPVLTRVSTRFPLLVILVSDVFFNWWFWFLVFLGLGGSGFG